MGRDAGLSEEQILHLRDFETSDAYSLLEKLVLRLTVVMCRTPCDVPADLFAALRAQLDDTQLVELAATIAWENYRGRFNRLFDISAQGFSEGAFCALPERPANEP